MHIKFAHKIKNKCLKSKDHERGTVHVGYEFQVYNRMYEIGGFIYQILR